ncbi:MAG: hypothetical protein GX580_13165 [Candidatus Hydrogenedens sp.]|nr:hypothetical protein [Candidatus Hydrogenedentota bacterium]NLF58577.1 hypothetical protein [Candidatus Hydrogenedens sp.]
MKKRLGLAVLLVLLLPLAACKSDPGTVGQKVLADFGIGEHPEGYVSGADKVYQELDTVGKTEIKRMNALARNGEIKFEEDGLRGRYYKEVKVYESFYPLDARAAGHQAGQDRGFTGLIEYTYRMYRGAAKPTRAEAAAESASIATDTEGKETFRYQFGPGGVWNGAKGERSNR